jgi:hypothetical protein
MVPLPPDLSRLGDELTAAAGRALDERRRRRRLLTRAIACALAGILTLTVLAPAALSPDSRSAALLAHESMATVLVRPPDRPPLLTPRTQHTRPAAGQLPERPPFLPALRRDA